MLHPRRQALGAIVLSAEPDGRKIERLEVPKATDQPPVFVPKFMLEAGKNPLLVPAGGISRTGWVVSGAGWRGPGTYVAIRLPT